MSRAHTPYLRGCIAETATEESRAAAFSSPCDSPADVGIPTLGTSPFLAGGADRSLRRR
jgi:hypothetical protein